MLVDAAKDYDFHQVNNKTAFFNGELEEEVFVTQPPGYDDCGSNVVCRLKKAPYGLKQALSHATTLLTRVSNQWGTLHAKMMQECTQSLV